jgi:hypothetical protein
MSSKDGLSLSDEAAAFARALLQRSRAMREAAAGRRKPPVQRADFSDTAQNTQIDFTDTLPPGQQASKV